MERTETSALVRRLEALERANQELSEGMRRAERRWRAGALLAVVLAGSTALLGWAQVTDSMTARAFELPDNLGSVRVFNNGMPGIVINHPDLPHYIQITAYPDGLMSMSMSVDGDSVPRMSVGLWDDGTPYIRMRDQNGNIVWEAP